MPSKTNKLLIIGGSDAGISAALRIKEIDPQAKQVQVRSSDGNHHRINYGKLLIATGAESTKPPIKGLENPGVFFLRRMNDSFVVKRFMDEKCPRRAVIIGGGYIGLEMADALTHKEMTVSLLESELFGYVRGAFTGAAADKPGRFQSAHQGTLFLDEISNTSLKFQADLLRVLEDGRVTPLGSSRSIAVDIRIIAASNADLNGLVREGSFRQDLYYRLNVVKISSRPCGKENRTFRCWWIISSTGSTCAKNATFKA